MTPGRWFFVDGQLRPVWRCFLSVVLMFFAVAISNTVVAGAFRLVGVQPSLPTSLLFSVMAMLVAVLGVFKLMTAVFEHRPLASMGLAFHSRWWTELGYGLAFGTAMMACVGCLEWALGLASFTVSSNHLFSTGSYRFLFLAVAATNEEVAFRGYPFQRLVESITPVGAVALTSALFGLAHLGNPHPTWISTANTMLAGIFLAVAYLRTRALWMPIGAHFTWNYVQGFVLGLPVSGIHFERSILQAQVKGADWLTGGSYGPEGGLLVTLVVVVGTIYLLLSKRIYTSKEMEALVAGPSSLEQSEPAENVAPADPEEDKLG